jgi:acetyl esterase
LNTRHLVDPEIAPLLDAFPSLEFSNEMLAGIREMFGTPLPDAPQPAFEPKQILIPGRHGAPDVPLLIFDPPGRTTQAAILHIHGGGMVLGNAAMGNISNAALAISLGIMIASVDYRLAPETPFPGPQEDCMSALDWMVSNAAARGIDPLRIAVMGESAGGGLAASAALMARDEGKVSLRAQFLTYPMLDHRTGTDARPGLSNTGEFIWTRAHNQFGWEALRGDYVCDNTRAGWFSPALAKDLSGLPPTFVATGALDLFLEEDLEYVRRLAGAGVPTELHVYPGAFHAFNMMPSARITQDYNRDLKAAISTMLLA